MNLRERKKQQAQSNIVNAAKDVFIQAGYTNAKMFDIASKADVGVGTIYNYYPSKGDLLIAVFAEELKQLSKEDTDGQSYIDNVIDAIVQFFEKAVKPLNNYPKHFMREIFGVVAGNIAESETIRENFVQLVQQFMQHIGDFLETSKDNGNIRSDLDVEQAVTNIYSIFAVQFLNFCYSEHMTLDTLLSQVRMQVEFALADKLAGN